MKIKVNRFYFIAIIIILSITIANLLFTSSAWAATTPQPSATPVPTTGYIMGRVTLPDDATGVPNCEIEILWKGDAGMAKATTDAAGNFYFTNLEPNDETWNYRLIATKGSWGRSVTQQFSVIGGSATVVGMRMYPYVASLTLDSDKPVVTADGKARVSLTATLLDVDGKPVPDDMHVLFTQSSYFPNPGTFFSGTENDTALTVVTRGGRATVQYGEVPPDTLARTLEVKASSVEGSVVSKTINLTTDLVSPNVITGTVYDLTNKPVPGARVFLARWDGVGKFTGYNSTEGGNATDGRGVCDANGTYRFAIMPAGDYEVSAQESSFKNSTRLTVVRGKYTQDIVLPLSRGSIKGWVNDVNSNLLPGVKVTLYRVDEGKLAPVGEQVSDNEGRFSFDDIWYGSYDLQAVAGDQTADMPFILDVPKSSVGIALHRAVNITPVPSPTNATNATPTAKGNATLKPTPKAPTPTPWDVTPTSVIGTYGLAAGVMIVLSIGVLVIILKLKPKE